VSIGDSVLVESNLGEPEPEVKFRKPAADEIFYKFR